MKLIAPVFVLTAALALAEQRPPAVHLSREGDKLEYTVDAAGNRVPDFSYAGYSGGGVALPDVPAKVSVSPAPGDATARIQAALDHVATLPPDAHGIRGAVVLAPGRYEISSQLHINASGVILRGSGSDEKTGTVLVATGTDRRALIAIRGKGTRTFGAKSDVADAYVPVNAMTLRIKAPAGFTVGTRVIVRVESDEQRARRKEIERERQRTHKTVAELHAPLEDWLHAIGTDVSPGRQQFSWKPDAIDITWDRTVVAVDGDKLTLDAPITSALDEKFGGACVTAYTWSGRLTQVGVENLRCESTFDASNPLDEQHAWEAIALDATEDAWISNVTAVHFAGSAINLGRDAHRVTVQDCSSLAPVSELGGYRRHTFHTDGELTLFLRCRAEEGRNDFTTGYFTGGPTAFVECSAEHSHGFSGSAGSWSSGTLFDIVLIDGGTLELNNRETWNQGVSWASANSMLWNCSAPTVINRAPPTAMNWADGIWGQFLGDGWWSRVNEFIQSTRGTPEAWNSPDIVSGERLLSLYRAQLGSRLGEKAIGALAPRKFSAAPAGLPVIAPAPIAKAAADKPLALKDGWLTIAGAPLEGRETQISWWRGYLYENAEPTAQAITRFTPGLSGPIFTDDLGELTDRMVASHQVLLRHHYGLWYERRRMDHERMRRPDGDVWPPFYEQPFARSGQGTAWDGLSKYDLTKYNPWYFDRLHQFAQLARQKGLVLVDEMYFQHNIIEAGAHWVDSPWRPTNNINGTGFTEPVPFTGDTMKMAAEFYDLSNPLRRELHRAFIRHCLANLADEPNVIHTLTAENSGPLHFMQFWLDVVAEWEKETGKHPLIALSACKDVQDAILADPKRAAVVDVIDLTYWWRTERGDEFAPKGTTDLAPRQQERLWKNGKPSARTVAAMAKEYRDKFPTKAVITGLGEAGNVQPR